MPITSVAELKRAIELACEFNGSPTARNKTLQLIDEFEAGIRERLSEHDESAKLMILREVRVSGHSLQVALGDELRRVLGEGEGGGGG